MRKKESMTPPVLRSLLVPLLTELDLSFCPYLVNRSLVQMIIVRCKNLTILNLSRCTEIPAEALVDLVKAFPRLQSLNLSRTQCDTQVLLAVRSYCQRLQDLNISYCERLSPMSLLHLVYDPIAGSHCSQALKTLTTGPQGPGRNRNAVLWSLVFVLLALPNLEGLFHDFHVVAVCLIYYQEFDNTHIPPGFPSLERLARRRRSNPLNESSSELTVGLRLIYELYEDFWPMVYSVCPNMNAASIILSGRSALDQSFWRCSNLTKLSIRSREPMDMREVLPVVTSLKAQLEQLLLGGFSFVDELSFHALLHHCVNLQTLKIVYFSPFVCYPGSPTNATPIRWDLNLLPRGMPNLRGFVLSQADAENSLPYWHGLQLRECLESLLKHSPCLEEVGLSYLSFNLDQTFQNVLAATPGTALRNLRKLTLEKVNVSFNTIQQLLLSDNELSCLKLFLCSEINEEMYDNLLRIVREENLEVDIEWR
ncbi:hypothetical protein JD844_013502 [Phrynosoma platyrhinos]|uniref:Uncharacterized protein n=1 Tax=Phrynosoma platyrhinos TaxID=52577 RepID=A0ABQ7TM39_PHRPL|nr:hypothetical protein JD844_013502 [Phrynosoma platyrhinos]